MLVELTDGHVDSPPALVESTFYVSRGEPVLYLDDARRPPGARRVRRDPRRRAARLRAGRARPLDRDGVARPRGPDEPPDTFFVGPPPDTEPAPLDLRDPRNRNLFLLQPGDMDIDRLKRGAAVDEPKVSASMATAALAYSGITVKMLVDKRLDAQLQTMFMVGYQPGAVAHPHDHPFEESYYMLEGEVDVVADGERYTLRPGDVFWTGVGCIHAFYETKGGTVLWLETSAPGPPDRHSYRFERDWEYLARSFASGRPLPVQTRVAVMEAALEQRRALPASRPRRRGCARSGSSRD